MAGQEIRLITTAKMQRYIEFYGDIDNWARSQVNGLDETLNGDEWNQIEKLVQRLRIQRNGSASIDYKNETERVLKKTFENEEAIQLARNMV
jgi:hypothetical protein